MNKLTIALIGVIIVLIVVIAFIAGRSIPRSQTQSQGSPEVAMSHEIQTLTIKQLRDGMLKYNGQQVRVKALLVDFADGSVMSAEGTVAAFGQKAEDKMPTDAMWQKSTNNTGGWIIADDLGSYFTETSYASTSDNGGSVKLTPAIPQSHQLDYVLIDGTYDANSGTISATNVQTTGHFSPAS